MTKLTPEQIASLEGQALVDAVAERVMGWTFDLLTHSWRYPNGMLAARRNDEWRPDWDYNDVVRVMEWIAELGLAGKCADHLEEMFSRHNPTEIIWRIATASPEARCRAALMAVEGRANG